VPLLLVQRWLFKILRPYWWQQRHIQASLLQGLRETKDLAMRATAAEPQQRAALQAAWTEIQALRAQLTSLGDDLTRYRERSTASDDQLNTLHDAVTTFQQNAQTHLQGLTAGLEQTVKSSAVLQQRLYASPYMADPSRFSYITESGQQTLGFRGQRNGRREVYAGFEDVFRGPEAMIADRFRRYLPLLQPLERVIDIGCGRGELLDVLRAAQVAASGIDTDAAMVQRCREKGHSVEHIDGVAYLRSQADGSLPAIFAAQVVEHLPYTELLAFLELSHAKLRPGGQLVFETVNPHCLEAFKTFYTDLTHQRPIFPEVAVALCWLMQFDEAYVFYPNGNGDIATDRAVQGEYAVVASKGLSERSSSLA
jgi:2-polyprenyl-3-methyl-5-hydroxy-6-metoxy-1,4-benzoquinol methylase